MEKARRNEIVRGHEIRVEEELVTQTCERELHRRMAVIEWIIKKIYVTASFYVKLAISGYSGLRFFLIIDLLIIACLYYYLTIRRPSVT